MPNMMNRCELPTGYTDQHDSSIWNVGEVFMWSNVYECWLDCKIRLTVKPNMTIEDAFEARMDEPMWSEYSVFFNLAFV
jgi:hypothetical protein